MILIGYMFLGCVISLFVVYKEIYVSFYKVNSEKAAIDSIKRSNLDLREDTMSKIKVWFNKKQKKASIFIYPNFFQIISRHL